MYIYLLKKNKVNLVKISPPFVDMINKGSFN